MGTTLGAFDWSTTRGVPASGEVTLASDPVAGVSNTLRVSITDRDGNDRDAVIDTVATGDVISVSAALSAIVGLPVDNTTYWAFPFTVNTAFVEADEPANDDIVTLTSTVPGAWPTVTELKQVLDVTSDDFDDTLEATLAAAISTVKSNVGDWVDSADLPTTNQGRAALRAAVLMAQSPVGPTIESFVRDPAYQAYMTGQRRKWGIG